MFSFQYTNKGLMEQTIHQQCIVKIYKGKKLENGCDIKSLIQKPIYIEQHKENLKNQ